jgi:hypothetical protein
MFAIRFAAALRAVPAQYPSGALDPSCTDGRAEGELIGVE